MFSVRLACVRHAASVRSEPGSNSPSHIRIPITRNPNSFWVLILAFTNCSKQGLVCLYSAQFSKNSRLSHREAVVKHSSTFIASGREIWGLLEKPSFGLSQPRVDHGYGQHFSLSPKPSQEVFSKSDSLFRTSKKIYETVGILNQNRFDVKPFFSHLLKRWVNFPGPTGPVCSQTHC